MPEPTDWELLDLDDGHEYEPRPTIPRMCRWFGHAWHNDHRHGVVIVHGEPCVRRGCATTRNDVPDDFELPDMSLEDDRPTTEPHLTLWQLGIPTRHLEYAVASVARMTPLGLTTDGAAQCMGIAYALFGVDGIVGAPLYVERIATLLADEGLVQRLERESVADQIHAVRHRNHTHPATPDTYYWGVTTAEKIARGEQP